MNSPPPAALVCLDLQRARVSGSPAAAAQVTGACRRVLEQARARAWPVLHVHRREATAEGARPIVGLEPLPTEPIYLRRGPSAFSHPAFARRALSAPLTSLFPHCRLIQADDLLQEEAAAFVAANAP